jgi:hypothetical protein
MEPEGSDAPKRTGLEDTTGAPATRRGALFGLIIILLLVAGGLALMRVLHGMAQVQDCALAGRSNCT